MIDIPLAWKLVNKLMHMAMQYLEDDYMPGTRQPDVSPPARCAKCGDEPWIIRWGSIRIGQQLDGYYYQATVGGDPLLLCRECWHRTIGVDDPLQAGTTTRPP